MAPAVENDGSACSGKEWRNQHGDKHNVYVWASDQRSEMLITPVKGVLWFYSLLC